MSASLLSKDTVRVCVCGKKRERYWLWTQVRHLCQPRHYCCWISTDRGKKKPFGPSLPQLTDKGLSFLQPLWRHHLSECPGKLYKSREMVGEPLPLPSSLPNTGRPSTAVPEMWFSVCSACTPFSPVHSWAQILSLSRLLPSHWSCPAQGLAAVDAAINVILRLSGMLNAERSVVQVYAPLDWVRWS